MSRVVFGSYEWDTDKAAEKLQKHGVSFFEAAERDRIISARIADSAEEQLYRQG